MCGSEGRLTFAPPDTVPVGAADAGGVAPAAPETRRLARRAAGCASPPAADGAGNVIRGGIDGACALRTRAEITGGVPVGAAAADAAEESPAAGRARFCGPALSGRISPQIRENAMRAVFLLAACVSVLAVALICVFLFANGVPAIREIGAAGFLLGRRWKPGNGLYGIFPMILGSLCVTAGAVVTGVPVGLMTAVFLSEFCPKKLRGLFRPAVSLLAGIPSVVYGFFGLTVIVPAVREVFGGTGNSMLSASVLLGIMILPTIISVSEDAVAAVPPEYYEGARALGATHERSVFRVVLPAARSGIFAGVILGIGRAVGETMAVIMVAGNQARMPAGILKGVRTLTANIVIEMGYATDLHRQALIATGVVLFAFILMINLIFHAVKSWGR